MTYTAASPRGKIIWLPFRGAIMSSMFILLTLCVYVYIYETTGVFQQKV